MCLQEVEWQLPSWTKSPSENNRLPHLFHKNYHHWATTGPLDLQALALPPLIVTVEFYWKGCFEQQNDRFPSVFVGIRDPDLKILSTPSL